MAMVTPCSFAFCPSATGPMSIPTNSVTWPNRVANAGTNFLRQGKDGNAVDCFTGKSFSTMAFSAVSNAAVPALLSRCRGNQKAILVKFRIRIKATKSPTPIPNRSVSSRTVDKLINPHFDMIPGHRQPIYFFIIAMPSCVEGKVDPRKTLLSEKIDTRAPSAKGWTSGQWV